MILTHFLALLQSAGGLDLLPSAGAVVRPFTGQMLIFDDGAVVVVNHPPPEIGPRLVVLEPITVLPVRDS